MARDDRPGKPAALNFRVDVSTLEEIRERAAEEDVDMSDVARRWLRRGRLAENAERAHREKI
jgi:hypothetical protein